MNTAAIFELLKDFVCKDHTRTSINMIWVDKGFLKATNGQILIIVPEALCPGHQVQPNDSAPDTDKLNLFDNREFSLFDIALLKSTVDPKYDEYEEFKKEHCARCEGEGRRTCCHCQDGTVVCEDCGGKGMVGYNRLGNLIPASLDPIVLLDRKFSYDLMRLLQRAMLLFEGNWQVSLCMPHDGYSYSFAPALFKNDAGVIMAIVEARK